jgi:NitT/TauT family transport system substrate-binding protein
MTAARAKANDRSTGEAGGKPNHIFDGGTTVSTYPGLTPEPTPHMRPWPVSTRLLWRLLLAPVAAVTLLLAACGSGGSSSDASGQTTVTIAYGAPVADHMVPSVAQAAGLFAKYGITVNIKFLESSQLLTSVVSQQVQFVSVPAPGPEILALNGTPVKQVAGWEDHFDNVLVAGPGVKSVADLDGKAIAISKPGSFSWLLAEQAQQQYHVSMKEVPVGNESNQVAAFVSGQVQAVGALSPSQMATVAKKVPGAHVLVDWRQGEEVPAMQFVGYGPWLSAHRSTAVKVLKAINDAVAYFKNPAHKAKVVGVIAKVTGETHAVAAASYADVLKALSSSIVPTVQAQKNALPLMAHAYPKAATFDASKLIDPSYASEAVR